MWKREDYTGTKEVVWYSEEEYKGIEKELAKFEEILYNGFNPLQVLKHKYGSY